MKWALKIYIRPTSSLKIAGIGRGKTTVCENDNEIVSQFELGAESQEGNPILRIEAVKIENYYQRDQEQKHQEDMLGTPLGADAICKGLIPEIYKMSVTCGGFTKILMVEDAANTHALMDPVIFISGPIAMNKAPQDYSVRELT